MKYLLMVTNYIKKISSQIKADYLTIDDIPPEIGTISKSLYGTLKSKETNDPFYTIDDALKT